MKKTEGRHLWQRCQLALIYEAVLTFICGGLNPEQDAAVHDAPVAEGDAAQALSERACGQGVQLCQGVANLDVALPDLEARGVRMAEVLRRADVRAQRCTECKLSRDILQRPPPSTYPEHCLSLQSKAREPISGHQACVHGWSSPIVLTSAHHNISSPVTSLS